MRSTARCSPSTRHAAQQAGDDAEDLVVDDELLEGHDLRAVEQAAAEDGVGAGEELEQHRQGVLPGRLGVGRLGLGAAVAEPGRQAVEAGHLSLDGAQQHRLGDGGEVGAGAHVERGGPARHGSRAPRACRAGWPTTAATISALLTTAMPAGVAGAVAPMIGIG